ncbi:MAG TPA: peptidoglycan DD-metalloendopeptidase family protein [Candidatus Sphingobacterium stercoripullorum]|nr:peptidoglycan DD-metalloendopeptidase family protein [Candidatus Sphingobacterium stercoripullorum]
MSLQRVFLILLFIAGSIGISNAQSSAELKKQRERIDQEIAELQKIIRVKIEAKMLSQKEVNALSRQLKLREDKINTISSELNLINKQINDNNKIIAELKAELQKMRDDYEKMILFAFRNKNAYNKMMFVFASKDFNQAFKRVKYLQQFNDARKIKAKEIEETQKSIELKVAQLEQDKKLQQSLLKEQQEERNKINKDRAAHAQELSKIVQEERTYQGQLSAKQKEKRRLDAAIQAAIRREVEEARRRAETARRLMAEEQARRTGKTVEEVEKEMPRKTDSEILSATPETAKLSANFRSNQGRLPWPVSRGKIVRPYGNAMTEQNVRVFNPDIAIQTPDNGQVNCIFDGEVAQAFPGTVVIRHGEFFTSYSNLKTVNVRKGQKIKGGEAIGTAKEDAELGYSYINFGIFQGLKPVNPQIWIAK